MSPTILPYRARWRRLSVAGVGVFLGILSLLHLFFDQDGLVTDAFEIVVPLVISFTLILFGGWLARSRYDPDQVYHIASWCLGGILVLALVGGWTVVLMLSEGIAVDESIALLTSDLAVGAGAGAVVGLYNVRRQEQFHDAQQAHDALETAQDGIAILDENGEYATVNHAHADLYGYDDPEAFVGATWQMCYSDEQLDGISSRVMPTLEAEGDWRGELVGERRDGTPFPQEATLSVRDDGGMVCVVRDITERKEREQELERQRDLFEQTQRMAHIGGWELDLGDDELRWTDEVYRIHDLPLEYEPSLGNALDYYHPEDAPTIEAAVERAIEHGENYDLEARLITAEGTRRWVRARGEARTDGGETVMLRGTIQDITERKERERELESTTNLLSTLIETLPVGILAEDSDRDMLFTNQEFCDLFGIDAPPEELIGSDCEAAAERSKDMFVDSERFIDRTNESVANRTPIDREEFDLVDGGVLERSAIPVDLDGEDAGHLWVYQDVTERTQYERRLDALHETTRELMAVTSQESIATQTSDAASEILDLPLNGVHLYDDTVEGLVPVAWSSATEEHVGEPPTFTPGDSIAWETFETGEARIYEDVRDADELYDPETPIRSELHLPLGEHGVFLVGETTAEAFDQTDVALAKLLATNVEAALDRAEREQALRAREDELERERDRFAALFEHIPDPAVTVEQSSGEPITRSVNQAFEDVFGYTEDKAAGTSLNDLIVPAAFEDEAQHIDERAQANEQIVQEVRRQTAEGEIRDFLFRNVPIGSDTGEAYGIYTDITERKRRERSLESLNEVTRRQIQASTPTRICELAVEAAQEAFDLPLSGVHLLDESNQVLEPIALSSDVTDRIDDSALRYTDHETVIWEAFEAGEARVLQDLAEVPDERLPDPDTPVRSGLILPIGTHGVFIVSSLEPHAFDEGDIHLAELLAATTAIALDRTVHERTLEQLHEATRKLITASDEQVIADRTLAAARDVLGFSLVSVRYLDADEETLVPVAITEEGRATLGEPAEFDRSESLAWEPLDTGEPRVVTDAAEHDASVNAGTGIRSLLILPLGEHGTLNIAAQTPDAFDDAETALARILAANVETALDRAADERELRERERELRRQNERLDEFASVLSHDLRNPLNVAQGRLELAQRDCETEHLDAVDQAHNRMEALIEDVLTLTREGRTVGETTTVSVAAVAQAAWNHVDTGDATLEVSKSRKIDADESRLRQLFENLFRNSVEHAGETCTVRVGTHDDPPGMYVEDDGPGIPPDEQDEVFDSGYSTASEGTGFGLSIVQQIAEAHGWEIDVTTGGSGGARFEIHGTTRPEIDDE